MAILLVEAALAAIRRHLGRRLVVRLLSTRAVIETAVGIARLLDDQRAGDGDIHVQLVAGLEIPLDQAADVRRGADPNRRGALVEALTEILAEMDVDLARAHEIDVI